MPRIRSVHPGFWTDEAVVSVSRDARLFLIGLWNQCDDKGVFEWKPVGLRMRIFPADAINVVALLNELERADLIRAFEADNRRYGVVRNFVIFQRPKKPNNLYPLQFELRLFNGMDRVSSEPGGNRSGKVESEEGGRRNPPHSPPVIHLHTRRKKKGGGWTGAAIDLANGGDE